MKKPCWLWLWKRGVVDTGVGMRSSLVLRGWNQRQFKNKQQDRGQDPARVKRDRWLMDDAPWEPAVCCVPRWLNRLMQDPAPLSHAFPRLWRVQPNNDGRNQLSSFAPIAHGSCINHGRLLAQEDLQTRLRGA